MMHWFQHIRHSFMIQDCRCKNMRISFKVFVCNLQAETAGANLSIVKPDIDNDRLSLAVALFSGIESNVSPESANFQVFYFSELLLVAQSNMHLQNYA